MKIKIIFLFLFFFASVVRAQTYSPILILNSSNVETTTAKYSDHEPGSSAGFGMVVYWPAFAGFNYRALAALQNRKFQITYNDNLERRYSVGTLDLGIGISTEVLDMLGLFVGLEATVLPEVDCDGAVPCEKSGGDMLAGQFQMGFNLGPSWLKFEPYYEHMPFAPISGTKSMTTYGFAIHFYPESFTVD